MNGAPIVVVPSAPVDVDATITMGLVPIVMIKALFLAKPTDLLCVWRHGDKLGNGNLVSILSDSRDRPSVDRRDFGQCVPDHDAPNLVVRSRAEPAGGAVHALPSTGRGLRVDLGPPDLARVFPACRRSS